jgi:predicted porin
MAAIGQVDIRFSTDIAQAVYAHSPTNVGSPTMSAGGNTWVGLRHKAAGSLVFGRADLHYGLFELNEISSKAGALMSVGAGLFDFINGTAIAGATRTNNVVMYDSPNWGGFEFRAAWSANPTGVETDLVNSSTSATTNTTRKGQAWNFNPKFTMGNWGVRYSHWDQKSTAARRPALPPLRVPLPNGSRRYGFRTWLPYRCDPAPDQVGDTILGWMSFGGLKVALGYNKSKLKSTDVSNTPRRLHWF